MLRFFFCALLLRGLHACAIVTRLLGTLGCSIFALHTYAYTDNYFWGLFSSTCFWDLQSYVIWLPIWFYSVQPTFVSLSLITALDLIFIICPQALTVPPQLHLHPLPSLYFRILILVYFPSLRPALGMWGVLTIPIFLKLSSLSNYILFAPDFKVLSCLFKVHFWFFFGQIHRFFAFRGVKTPYVLNDAVVTGNAITMFFTALNITCVKRYVLFA